MKFSRSLFLFPVAAALLPFAGCAKSPSGGPVNQVPNRMQVTLSIRGGLSAKGYYAVAFDDDNNTRRGPVAIIGSTNGGIRNGIVGGTFRFVVIYNANRFTVYRRPNPEEETTELVELTNTPFVGNITPRATNNSINFTLNLDARASDGSYYFAHDNQGQLSVSQIKVNAVATTQPFTDPQDPRVKPVDALGTQTTSSPETVIITGTRNANLNDDLNDLNIYDPSFIDPTPATDPETDPNRELIAPARLDIQSLVLNIVRG